MNPGMPHLINGESGRPYYFKKGDPRINRKGQPRMPKEAREIKNLTREAYIFKFSALLQKSHQELYKIKNNTNTDILTAYLCSCLLAGKLRGDFHTMDKMLDRIIGKVNTPVELTGANGQPLPTSQINIDFEKYSTAILKKIEKQLAKDVGENNGRKGNKA